MRLLIHASDCGQRGREQVLVRVEAAQHAAQRRRYATYHTRYCKCHSTQLYARVETVQTTVLHVHVACARASCVHVHVHVHVCVCVHVGVVACTV